MPPKKIEHSDSEVEINASYVNLTKDEIGKVEGWLEELKPQYASLIKTIKFTKNQSELDSDSNRTIGINRKGHMMILYTGKYNDKRVINHEILHNVVDLPYDIEEWFVDDIGLCMSAYKNGF